MHFQLVFDNYILQEIPSLFTKKIISLFTKLNHHVIIFDT